MTPRTLLLQTEKREKNHPIVRAGALIITCVRVSQGKKRGPWREESNVTCGLISGSFELLDRRHLCESIAEGRQAQWRERHAVLGCL